MPPAWSNRPPMYAGYYLWKPSVDRPNTHLEAVCVSRRGPVCMPGAGVDPMPRSLPRNSHLKRGMKKSSWIPVSEMSGGGSGR